MPIPCQPGQTQPLLPCPYHNTYIPPDALRIKHYSPGQPVSGIFQTMPDSYDRLPDNTALFLPPRTEGILL